MAIILFNPTNELFKTQYAGEDVILEPGAKVRVDDARGRHVLSDLGPRGLVTLEYGDEGEGERRKAQMGRERNIEFKRKHVMRFNSIQDSRQQQRLPFTTPDETVKAYARELGIKLYEPYGSKDEFTQVNSDLQRQVNEKDDIIREQNQAIATMQAQMAELTAMVGKVLSSKATAGDPEAQAYWSDMAKKARTMNGKYFHKWVADNWEAIEAAPTDIKAELSDKYSRLYGVPYPKDQVEAQTQAQSIAA